MISFRKQVWATVVGLFVFSTFTTVLSLIMVGIFSFGLAAASKKPIKDKTVLKLDFALPIVEKSKDNPIAALFGDENNTSLEHVLKTIKHAAIDPKIAGIYIQARQVRMGAATSATVRAELEKFKKSGKFIYAFSDVMTEGAYYMASVADKIYLAPEGVVELNGLGGQSAFLKGMFAKLEIEPQVFRVGKFKGAVEPFILEKFSAENREQTSTLLNSIYGNIIADISRTRHIPAAELRTISDSMLVRDADLAVSHKLVDKAAYYDEVETDLKKVLKLKSDEKINFMSLSGYGSAAEVDDDEAVNEDETAKDAKIAVIYAEGGITTGKSDDGIGSDDLVPLLRKARQDKKIKAIVLRINSPGGDALASDLIWREIILTNKTKPVIASMGDVAASGGYYIAMGARKIYAEPTTITGSIGVFGLFFNAGPLFTNKMGITFDAVKTGAYSDFPTGARRLTPAEGRITQHAIDRIYTTFTTKAAEGRHMPLASLQAIAQGRVWSGSNAKDLGLVDVLGGLDAAIAEAAKEAKLAKGTYSLKRMPESEDFATELVNKLMGTDDKDEARIKAVAKAMGPQFAASAHAYLEAQRWQGYQARMPFTLSWE